MNPPPATEPTPPARPARPAAEAPPAPAPSLLLDQPVLSPDEVERLEQTLAVGVGTSRDVVHVASEATLALEAAAAGLAGTGTRALNVVTGPYGHQWGRWLAGGGVEVVDLEVPFDRPVHPDEVVAALADGAFDLLAVVHAEAATGVVNDLDALCAVARRHEALIVVDAVASVGAEPLAVDALGLDLCVVGAQKGLAGPFGVSAAVVSEAMWARLRSAPSPLRRSSLSLLDWKEGWIDGPRTAIPVYLPVLETRALQAALDRVLAEGIDQVVDRHRRAATATRAGVEGLGLRPWVDDPAGAAAVATLVCPPDGVGPAELLAATAAGTGPVEVAPGTLADRALRIGHTGRRATLADVLGALVAIADGLEAIGRAPRDGAGAALDAARQAWARAGRPTH